MHMYCVTLAASKKAGICIFGGETCPLCAPSVSYAYEQELIKREEEEPERITVLVHILTVVWTKV